MKLEGDICMFNVLCNFNHTSNGIMVVIDPGLDYDIGINNIVNRITADNQGDFELWLPAGNYICKQDNGNLDLHICKSETIGIICEGSPSTISTAFSRNVCMVSSDKFGSSSSIENFEPYMVQFNPTDMLDFIKKNNITISGKCRFELNEAVKNEEFPYGDILDDSIVYCLKEIPSTLWNNYVMIGTHESENWFFKIDDGISFKSPSDECKIIPLYDDNGPCGLKILYCLESCDFTDVEEPQFHVI